MKIINIEQGTPEWYELRRSKIGASDIATIMAGSKRDLHDLYLSKVNGHEKFVTKAMLRGKEMEAEARAWMNINNDFDFEPIVGVSDDHDWLMASFDGFQEGISLEIKCPMRVHDCIDEHNNYSKWWWQVQAQYAVGGHKQAILLAYSPEMRVYSTISRDEDAIRELIRKGKEFYDRVVNYDPPEEEIEQIEDSMGIAQAWLSAKRAKDIADAHEESARKALIEFANNKTCKIGEVAVRKMTKRGAIEYKQIVELKEIDLEKYRKDAIVYWKVEAPTPQG